MAEVCQPGGKIGELGGEDRGELGMELKGDEGSDNSSGDMARGREVKRRTFIAWSLSLLIPQRRHDLWLLAL